MVIDGTRSNLIELLHMGHFSTLKRVLSEPLPSGHEKQEIIHLRQKEWPQGTVTGIENNS
jgi:hypothetical protein